MANEKRVEIRPPAGFVVPEGTQAGGRFDIVDTWELKKDGTICLVQLGDVQMPGYGDKRTEHKQDYSGYAQEIQSANPGMAENQGY